VDVHELFAAPPHRFVEIVFFDVHVVCVRMPSACAAGTFFGGAIRAGLGKRQEDEPWRSLA
jgi:hypothetical protein